MNTEEKNNATSKDKAAEAMTPEQIKKEAKRRVNLTVEVSSFRTTQDAFFWLVETPEIFRVMESRRTIFE